MADLQPGRSCPLDYRYSPEKIAQAPALERGAVYAAGGLYGNLSSLAALEGLLNAEPCANSELIFNGDFHWFDAQPDWFAQVEHLTSKHTRLRGNVETEFARAHEEGAGCGCAYPDGVDEGVVERSNRIEQALAGTARLVANNNTESWDRLPMYLRRSVGGVQLAVVHGDMWSLSGWSLMQGLDPAVLEQECQQANVQLIFSSHTCEAFDLIDAKAQFGVLNNGCAGMPNIAGQEVGLVCRIGLQPHPSQAVKRWQFGGVWVEWLALPCTGVEFTSAFLQRWPAGTDAYESYWRRIERGLTAPAV